MSRKKLTNSAVEQFTCGVYLSGTRKGQQKGQDILWCGEVRGFGMRLSAKSGTRTYIFVGRVKGSDEDVYNTIGRHNDPWRVDQARARALELKRQLLSGVNPKREEEKRLAAERKQSELEAALATPLRAVMEHYLEHKRTKHGPLRPETKKDIRRHVENNLADWIDCPVAQITRDMVITKFAELTRKAPVQANICMRYLRALCNHAREMHATPRGEYPVLPVNPVKQMIAVRKFNPERARKDRIPLDKVGAVWLMLSDLSIRAPRDHERTACDWLSMVLLTGLRRLESGAVRRSDIDLEKRTIHLRGDVADSNDGFSGVKNHNTMVLPMSTVLFEILSARMTTSCSEAPAARRRKRKRNAEYIFPSFGRKRPYITSAPALLRRISRISGRHISMHSLRRTHDDIAMQLKIDSDLRRQLLNHLASDVHGQFYTNNPDPEVLRPAVEAMAEYVVNAARIAVAQTSGANVVAFPRKAS